MWPFAAQEWAMRHLPTPGATGDDTGMEKQESARIRLVLLDDNDAARGRSVARLSQHAPVEIVGAVADGADAVKLVQELQPDAVLVETRRRDERGIEAISLLSALDGATRPAIVAYLEILHRGDWPDAQAAGADDLLLKEMPPRLLGGELRNIVDRVRHGTRADRSSAPGNSER